MHSLQGESKPLSIFALPPWHERSFAARVLSVIVFALIALFHVEFFTGGVICKTLFASSGALAVSDTVAGSSVAGPASPLGPA